MPSAKTVKITTVAWNVHMIIDIAEESEIFVGDEDFIAICI
jgi:hypothetical protein